MVNFCQYQRISGVCVCVCVHACTCLCVYREKMIERQREIYFKELPHVTVEPGKSKLYRVAGNLETQKS